MIEYYRMLEAVLDDGTPVWIGVHPDGIEILDLSGNLLYDYLTTTDPMLWLASVH